jgi:hypothetical protein
VLGPWAWAYLVDLDRLRSAVGSKDARLLAFLEEKHADFLLQEEERITLYGEGEHEISPREALRRLIEGDIPPDSYAGCIAAFEILCTHVGERLDDEDLLGDLWDLDIETALLRSGPPIPLAGLEDRIGFLTVDQAADEFERLKDRDLSHPDEDIEAAREKLRYFIEQARSRGKALVTVTC